VLIVLFPAHQGLSTFLDSGSTANTLQKEVQNLTERYSLTGLEQHKSLLNNKELL
jgi:hypothetical protein